MLHQLQLESCDPPLFSLRELAADAQALIQTLDDVNVAAKPPPSHESNGKETSRVSPFGMRPIRWNTQAPTSGYAIFTERMAKTTLERPKYPVLCTLVKWITQLGLSLLHLSLFVSVFSDV